MGERSQHKAARTCLGCRELLDRDDLVRYVLAPDGTVLVDYRKRLPGRGAYTCARLDCLASAVKQRQFSRSFKGRCQPPGFEQLAEELRAQLQERVLALIGIARKSGQTLSGSSQVLATLGGRGDIGLVVLAGDISAGIGERVQEAAGRRSVPTFTGFDKERLGNILGKEQRSVVAIREGALAETIRQEIFRYTQVLGES